MRRLFPLLVLICLPVFAQLPDAPAPQRDPVSAKAFWIYSSIDVTSTVGDLWQSVHYIVPTDSRCHEIDPLYGYKPSAARYWITGSAILAGEQILAWELRKKHKPWWPAPMLIDAVLHNIGTLQTPHAACL